MPLFNSPNIPAHAFLKLNKKEFSELKRIMIEVERLAEKYKIQTNADHVLERGNEFTGADSKKIVPVIRKIRQTGKEVKAKKPWEPCYQPWLTMTIAADGTCRACCFLHYAIDDVKNKNLEEVWNGHVFNKLREEVYKKGSVAGCEGCAEPVILRNKEIEAKLKSIKKYPLIFREFENKENKNG